MNVHTPTTMETTHTPGPWNIIKLATPEYSPEYGIYAGDSQNDLARVINDNSAANALLISAAPELLATLIECVESGRLSPLTPNTVKSALSAINKATQP